MVVGFLDVSISWNRSVVGLPIQADVTGTGGRSPPDSDRPGRYISILSIRSVQLNHAGEYVCSASNQGGTFQLDITIEVISPVAATIVGLFSNPVPAVLGANLVLFCAAQGNPPPQLAWLNPLGQIIAETVQSDVLGDNSVEVDLRHELNLLTLGAAGQYMCVASNRIGTDQGNVSIQSKLLKLVDFMPYETCSFF